MNRNVDDSQWKYNYVCAFLIVSFNIGIIVTCRLLLDAENDFNKPVLTVSFCFGCCCCCCCVGKCFKWIGNACSNYVMCDLAEAWTQSMHRPAAEALRQQHEQINKARKHLHTTMPVVGLKRPINFNFGKPISIVPALPHRSQFIV